MDIRALKNYIYENEYAEDILKDIGCHHIKYHSDKVYWTCANKTGDNNSAIVLKNNEYLSCINYTKRMIDVDRKTDIIDLISYTKELNFKDTLKYICNFTGINYYHDFEQDIPESIKIINLMKELNSENNIEEEDIPLKPISEKILTYYKPYANDFFYNDNIDYYTQREFEIGYDEETNRISIPIRSMFGDLVGVKGRLFKKELENNDVKYIYIEPCSKSKIIYGLNKTLEYINENGVIYVGEAEKFVLQLWSMGTRNSGSTGGKTLSSYQIDILVRLGKKIIFCFDKDVTKQELEELAQRFPDGVPLFYMFDEDNILKEKESPSDNPQKWKHMLDNNIYKLR